MCINSMLKTYKLLNRKPITRTNMIFLYLKLVMYQCIVVIYHAILQICSIFTKSEVYCVGVQKAGT